MTRSAHCSLASALFLMAALPLGAQQTTPPFPSPLDLGRDVKPLVHTPLPEEYIWTAGGVTQHHTGGIEGHTEPHLFRRTFRVDTVPQHATLYIAGPRFAEVFLNGRRLGSFASDPDGPINFRVFHIDVTQALQRGDNVLALKVVRGRSVVSGEPIPELIQLAYGEVLAVKILAAPFGHDGPALVRSDKQWLSLPADTTDAHFADPHDDNPGWKPVESLGPIESNRNFMQWSADAGMYAWPGYMGMSTPLGTYTVTPAAITHVFQGTSHFDHIDSLTSKDSNAAPFTVTLASDNLTDLQSPAILVDFGRELAGRLLVDSTSNQDETLSIAYGESELEAMATGLTSEQRGGNYLGTNLLDVPANGTARGPKSAFRYVRIRFLRGGPEMRLRIRAEGIAYPVTFGGSFESSDPLLNHIWKTGAYTAHLCMQDDLWDAPKRDRGRWAGDMDVEGRVISTAFGETSELERTLAELAKTAGPNHAVNGISGYSALWITTLGSLYAHAGDLEYLKTQHDALLRVLAGMDTSIDSSTGLYAPHKGAWPFIDWAPGLYGPSPAVNIGTDLQYIRGYRAAAIMLRALSDTQNATRADASADNLISHLRSAFAKDSNLFGHSPQIAALTLTSGFVKQLPANTYDLPHIKEVVPTDPAITPYLNMTVLDALSILGDDDAALRWIRTYWGGMIAEGATSFWENYDLRWPKDANYPLSLQADGSSGYFTSLSHGWSSGPTAWLTENILGVREPADGYRTFTFSPHLLDLEFANGSVPTPHGIIRVSLRKHDNDVVADLELPSGIDQVNVALGPLDPTAAPTLDGRVMTQSTFALRGAGKHAIAFTPAAR